MKILASIILTVLLLLSVTVQATAQKTNPVDRRVNNPLPESNSKKIDQVDGSDGTQKSVDEGGDGELVVYSEIQSVEGESGKRILKHQGSVDVRYGFYRLRVRPRNHLRRDR